MCPEKEYSIDDECASAGPPSKGGDSYSILQMLQILVTSSKHSSSFENSKMEDSESLHQRVVLLRALKAHKGDLNLIVKTLEDLYGEEKMRFIFGIISSIQDPNDKIEAIKVLEQIIKNKDHHPFLQDMIDFPSDLITQLLAVFNSDFTAFMKYLKNPQGLRDYLAEQEHDRVFIAILQYIDDLENHLGGNAVKVFSITLQYLGAHPKDIAPAIDMFIKIKANKNTPFFEIEHLEGALTAFLEDILNLHPAHAEALLGLLEEEVEIEDYGNINSLNAEAADGELSVGGVQVEGDCACFYQESSV
jgi:hypothetical protein